MDLRQLHYFSVLAETSSFRRAAEKLNMSQPPLTVAIRKLEDELGVTLFERTSKGAMLTPAGVAALPAARRALAGASELRLTSKAVAAGSGGRLRIGFVGSCIFELLPRLVCALRARYPDIELSLEEATTHDIVPRILSRELDAGLVRLPLLQGVNIEQVVIDRDHLMLAVPTENPIAQRGVVDLKDLANETFVSLGATSILRSTTLLACRAAGFSPLIEHEAPQLSTILCLVRSGLGIALIPAQVRNNIPPGVQLLRLKSSPVIETGIVIATEDAPPLVSRLKALALDLFVSP